MSVEEEIKGYIASLVEPKQSEMQALHELVLRISPTSKLWFTDGKNGDGKVVSNPNIGYGFYTINYADGSSRDFYRIGLSANTAGISVYVLGIDDKAYLSKAYGENLGKATVTGYCIKFKTLKNLNIDVLEAVLRYGLEL